MPTIIQRSRTLFFTAFLLLPVFAVGAQRVPADPIVVRDTKHDVSLPLRDMMRNAPTPRRIEPLEPKRPKHFFGNTRGYDPVVQQTYLPNISTTNLLNFDAMTSADSGDLAVPDTNGSVGSSQFVEIVNVAFAVYDKSTGAVILPATPITAIWSGFGGPCETSPGGDPVVLWDKTAQRWLVTELGFSNTAAFLCVAVSTGPDATGTYFRYFFNAGSHIPDYPKYGVWPDGYYFNVNLYTFSRFLGSEPCALDRISMLSGGKASLICIPPNPNNFGFLPSDFDGTIPPPAGAPNHYVELGNQTNQLKEFDFHVDFAHPKNSTFVGPHTIAVPNFALLCNDGGNFACIPQPSPGERVDSLSGLLMFRLAYRNFGDHEAMVVAHSVAPGQGSTATAATRWYELRATPSGSAFSLYQAGTYQHPTISLWMPSMAMDKQGNIALGTSAVNTTNVKPSIAYTGRVPSDPLGKLEAPSIVVRGSAVQVNGRNRWGDYSSMSVDSADDCTFWFAEEYYNQANGGPSSNDWTTRLVSFKFNSCQ